MPHLRQPAMPVVDLRAGPGVLLRVQCLVLSMELAKITRGAGIGGNQLAATIKE